MLLHILKPPPTPVTLPTATSSQHFPSHFSSSPHPDIRHTCHRHAPSYPTHLLFNISCNQSTLPPQIFPYTVSFHQFHSPRSTSLSQPTCSLHPYTSMPPTSITTLLKVAPLSGYSNNHGPDCSSSSSHPNILIKITITCTQSQSYYPHPIHTTQSLQHLVHTP